MTISYDVAISDYHASALVSHSKLADFVQRGPRYFAMQYVQRTRPVVVRPAESESDDDESSSEDKSDALVTGQAFEDLLCGGADVFSAQYAIKPRDMKFSTKDGKAWRAEQLAAKKTILAENTYLHIVEMCCAIHENDKAAKLIAASRQQPTIRWDHPGLPGLQARPDFYCEQGLPVSDYRPFTVDLKSTSVLTRISSGRSVLDYGYHRQAALVARGLAAHGVRDVVHYLLAVEKCSPHRAQVVELHPVWLREGEAWCTTQLERLARYYERGEWPRVEEEIVTLEAPAWMRAQHADNDVDYDDAAAE